MIRYHNIFSRTINRPLFCEPATALTIYNVLAGRFGTATAQMPSIGGGEEVRTMLTDDVRSAIQASRFVGDRPTAERADGRRAYEPYLRTREGVGVVTVDGEMVNRGAWVGSDSGLVSYEGVKHQLGRAARDPKTKAIILDVNTPGGEALGATEMGAYVKAVAEHKPVFAIANGMAASAGYAMVAGATRVFNTPSGILGSIGCILLHMDVTKAAEQEGLKPTLITAGNHKADGHPLQPLTEDSHRELQKSVDLFYEQFASTVGNGRGRKLSAKAARETEARIYVGKEAVAAGLADDVGSFEDILSELTAKMKRKQ